jgi:release factor glutamine methyltransferase
MTEPGTGEGAAAQVVHAYAEGRCRFMGVELLAAPGALVPRAETELLGATALREIEAIRAGGRARRGSPGELRVVDMCCGSGNLACGIAAAVKTVRVWACDLTDGCVSLARRNAEHLGLGDRVTVHQGDLFSALAGLGLEGTIDAVVCNPPYISTGKLEGERAALLEHEPREAFDGGTYGIAIHQRVMREALELLVPDGSLLFELGAGQGRQVAALFARVRAYGPVELVSDATGEARVAVARRAVP